MAQLISARFKQYAALQQVADNDPAHLTEALGGQYLVHVAEVQQALIDLGFAVTGGADGHYGPATGNAVASYKTDRNILNTQGQIDRIVGNKTISRIDYEIDALDDPPPPCFVAEPAGILVPPESADALNYLLDIVGAGLFVLVDDEGRVFDVTGGELDSNVVLGVAGEAAGLIDGSGDVGLFGDALQLLAAEPAVLGQPAAVARLVSPPGSLIDLSVLGAPLVAALLAFPVGPTPASTPARSLTQDEALALVIDAHNAGEIVLVPDPNVTAPASGQLLKITADPVAGVRFKALTGPNDRKSASYGAASTLLHTLDARHLIGLIRLCRHLSSTWNVTEIHHVGISGDPAKLSGDCHQAGRACGLTGVRLTRAGTDRILTVWNDWWGSSVPNPDKPGTRARDWPHRSGVKTEFRIASDAGAEQLLKDFWPDLYAAIASDFQDRSQGPGPNGVVTIIGEASSVMSPDHPTSELIKDVLRDKLGVPILKDGATIPVERAGSRGREAHQNHVHFQIGPTGTKI